MPQNKIRRTYILKEETNAMGVAQIMLGLIHSALGTLWFFLYNLENEEDSVGSIGMVVIISYLFVSGSFVVFSIVMNTISILVSVIGIIIFGIEFPAFESLGIEYIWSNMAGMVLLQISVACTISEMITAIIVSRWFRKVFAQQKLWDEGSLPSKSIPESPSPHEIEKLSENS